ncbi:MAG: helix-turn-helix transcriptional regulator [Sphingomonas sp.]
MTPDSTADDPIDGEGAATLAALRRALRNAGWTQARLAQELGVGSATVKRWLHGRGLGFATLGRLCALAQTSLAELTDAARLPDAAADHLTLAQEEALTRDADLSTVFFLILNGWPAEEASNGLHIPPETVARHVDRLERLALLDRLPGGRVRARLRAEHAWQRAPMRRHFERHLKPLFNAVNFGDPETIFGAATVKLSPLGVALLRERIEAFRRDVQAIENDDRRHATLPGEWHAVLAVASSMVPIIRP